MKKRLTAGILALALWLTLIPLSLQKAEATQSCSAQFRSGYSLTGNGADDLVAVAAAQVGMRTEDFGYTEDWCADFIADCATLAGLSKLIPANGAVSAMRSAVIAAGAQYWEYTAADTINNIKKGDIIVLETNRHIAIVEYVDSQGIHCLDGNWGSATPMVTRVLRSFDNNSNTDWHQYITMVLRPAYAAKHTVSFQTNYSGGEAIAAQTVSDGGCLGSLPKPIREGYAFLGWFSDPEDGEAFTVNTPVYNDLTLYAHWGFLEAGNSCGDSVSWSLSDGVLTIWGHGAIKDYTGLDQPWSATDQPIYSIQIENGVTAVGRMAFAGLSQVESVDLPPSLQTIGERAFIGCSSLRFLTLPENLTSIGIMAFAYCGHVTDIILLTPEAYIAGDAFMGVTALVTYSRLSQWTESRQQGYGGSLIWQQETLRGDANGDGTLNLADVSALFRIISGQVPLSVDQKALDMDGNGYLSLKDVYLLYQIAK